MDGVSSITVDSTATAWITTKDDKEPSRDAMNKLLGRRHQVSDVVKTSRAKSLAKYELVIGGMG